MMGNLTDITPFLLVFGFAAIIVELILTARWSPFYFSVGVPIYRRTIMVQPATVRLPTAAEIEAALPDSGRSAPVLVRGLGENRFAFREKLFHFGIAYSPLMHGCITCNPETGGIKVRGYLNWYIPLFSFYLLYIVLLLPFDSINVIIPACILVLMLYIYWMQAKRFRGVGDALGRLWGERV